MLWGSASPRQAMSKAVPWSTEVRTMGSPRATVTLHSKPCTLMAMWPWSAMASAYKLQDTFDLEGLYNIEIGVLAY